MDKGDKAYVETVMKERGWVRLQETIDEIYLSSKPSYTGGIAYSITLKPGALIFSKGYSNNGQTAIISAGATTLYLFSGSSGNIISQKSPPWPEVTEHSFSHLNASADGDTVLGAVTNKTSAPDPAGKAPTFTGGDIMDAIRQSAGKTIRSVSSLRFH